MAARYYFVPIWVPEHYADYSETPAEWALLEADVKYLSDLTQMHEAFQALKRSDIEMSIASMTAYDYSLEYYGGSSNDGLSEKLLDMIRAEEVVEIPKDVAESLRLTCPKIHVDGCEIHAYDDGFEWTAVEKYTDNKFKAHGFYMSSMEEAAK